MIEERTPQSRITDARDLTELFDALRYTPDDLLQLSDDEWQAAALLAGTQRRAAMGRPDDALKSLVWARLAERRRLESTHPLQGLPS